MQFFKFTYKKNVLLALSFLIGTFISCDTPLSKQGSGRIGRLPASVTAELFSKEEKDIALRICYAFRLKRFQFQMEESQSLVYENVTKTCDGQVEKKQETIKVASGDESEFFQTEKSGWLKPICKSLMRGEEPESNIITYSNDEIKTINFYRDDKLDGFKIQVKKLNEYAWQDDKTLFFLISTYEVDPLQGFVKRFGESKPCAGKEDKVSERVSKLSHKETSLWAQSQ